MPSPLFKALLSGKADATTLASRSSERSAGGSPCAVGPGTLVDGALHPAWALLRAEPIADAVAGRPYLYALAAGGERGVGRLLGWFRDDVTRTMTLLGAGQVGDLDRRLLGG